jgi:hypothetical protein
MVSDRTIAKISERMTILELEIFKYTTPCNRVRQNK